MSIYDSYTVYECEKCHYYYRSSHGGRCPNCGGKLYAAKCIGTYYNAALD
ncbi:MAG: hypothetical protein HDT29_04830 [Clostridiales bacterium]|nr:hypothetical protein [Clostridiales bacterium]